MREEEFLGTSRFHVLAELGSGGMGVVYRAHDREKGCDVALKTLQCFAPRELYRLKHEFRALSDVVHPNLVRLYELISEDNRCFFTMELVEGVSFRAWVWRSELGGPGASVSGANSPSARIRDVTRSLNDPTEPAPPQPRTPRPEAPCDLERLRPALRQLALGVSALHRGGQVHRDIKPSNVLVTRAGRVVLLDFGLVSERGVALRQSFDEPVLGTPAYMSPEQVGGEQLGPASDWYSVGVLLYEVLTGSLPFEGTVAEVLDEKQHLDPTPPSELANIPGDLNELCMALLRRRPQDRPDGDQVLTRVGGAVSRSAVVERGFVPAPIFVGRRAELAALSAAYAEAREGTGLTLHVHGQSGIGKTALIERFLGLTRTDTRATVLAGRCNERETVPYKGLDSLIDALSRYLRHLGRGAAVLLPRDLRPLVRLFPVLGQAEAVVSAPLPAMEISDPQDLRRRAFASLKELLARIADRGPLVLCIDDVQWGDVDSAALLTDLMRPPDAPVALLILSYRREDIASSACIRAMRAQELAADGGVRELHVDPLTADDARELAMSLLPTADVDRAAKVAQEGEGHPLFVAELAREGSTAPSTLEEMLRGRVAQLEPDARRLLEVISVAGGPIEAEPAFRAAQTDDPLGTLALLRAGRLVRAAGASDHLEAYHDRIRETVAKHLDGAQVREYHAALARALEASGRGDPEALAIHFREAGERARAGEYAATAAAQASSALAFDRAARLYRLALDLDSRGHESARLLRVKLGDALANAGRGAEAARAYLAAADGADGREALELRRRAMEQFLRSGHFADGLATGRTVLEAVGMTLPATPARALAFYLGGRARLRLRGLGHRERCANEIPADELTRIDVCSTIGYGLWADTIRGTGFQTRHLLLALRAGEPHRIVRALAWEVAYSAVGGERSRERTARVLQRAQALAQRLGDPYAIGLASLMDGVAGLLEGQYRRGYDACTRAMEILRNQPNPTAWEISSAQATTVRCLLWTGELIRQRRVAEAALAHAEDHGDTYAAIIQHTYLAYNLLVKDDDLDRARRHLDGARVRLPSSGFHVAHWEELLVRVWADLYAGDSAGAWGRLREQRSALRWSMLLKMQAIRIIVLYQRACCALALAADGTLPERYLRSAERDTRRLEKVGARWSDGLARLVRAGIANVRGDVPTALIHLEASERAFAAKDMLLLASIARRRRGALLGGEKGRALISAAEEWMASQNVRNPARASAVWAPGFVP